ncbi:MAG: PAS domain S-box protein [Chloroflexota bacterium]|nr:PAS domain S-box protein [Chloroflexota bacterium]
MIIRRTYETPAPSPSQRASTLDPAMPPSDGAVGLDIIAWEADPQSFQFTWVSERAETVLGYPVARWLTEPNFWPTLVHPDDRDRVVAASLAAARDGHDHDLEYRAVAADGRVVWLREGVQVVRGPDGRVQALRGLMIDVSKHRRAEEAVRASEERYRLLFEANPHPMWVHDMETLGFLAVNDAAVQHYGYTRDEFLSMTLLDIRPAEDRPAILARVAQLRQDPGGLDSAGIWRHRTKDGTLIDVEVTTHALDMDGRPARLALAHDITQQRQTTAERERLVAQLEAERAELETERGRLEAVLRELPAGVIIAEAPSGQVVLGNEQVERILRQSFHPAADITGYREHVGFFPDGSVYEPEDWPLSRTIRTGETVQDEEIDISRGDGSRGTIRVSSAPIRDRDGQIVAAVTIFSDVTEQRRAADELRQSRDQLAVVLQGVGDGITAQDPSGRLVFANDAAASTLGFASVEALLAAPLPSVLERFEILDEAGAPFPLDRLPGRLALLGEQPPEVTLRYRVRETGEERTVMVRATPVYERGQVPLAINIFRDVTERKRAEETRRVLTEATLQLAASLDEETMLVGMARLAVPTLADFCLVDLLEAGEIRHVAAAHQDPERAALVQEMQRRYPIKLEQDLAVTRAMRTGASGYIAEITDADVAAVSWDEEHLRLRRTLAFRSAMFIPLQARGRVLGAITFFSTVPERRYGPADVALAEDLARRSALAVDNARLYEAERRARAEAEAAQRRLAFLAEASALLGGSFDREETLAAVARLAVPAVGDWCVIHLCGEDGSLRLVADAHANPAKIDLLRDLVQRYPGGPNAPHGPSRVVRTELPEMVVDIADEILSQMARDAEHLRLLRDLGLVSSMTVPLRARGRTLGTVSFATAESGRRYELADLKLAEDLAGRIAVAVDNARLYTEAQEAVRARDQFLSIAAHELRTPVAGVKGYAQMLLRSQARDTLTAEKITQGLRTLDQVSDRLTGLTNDLLDVSRIRLGQLPLRPRQIDFGGLVREVAQRIGVGLGDRHPLVLVLPDQLPPMVIDPDRIEQVLTNLLDNAAKYSPGGGPIHLVVEADEAGEGILVTVRDTGIGLPAAAAEAIFEPFGRAENAIQQNLPGLGLGLYICRSIAERHGGRIWAESAGDGQGTAMRLWLPIQGPEDEP